MMKNALEKQLKSAFDGIQVDFPKKDQMDLTVKKDAVMAVLSFLKSKGLDHLGLISCVDWIDKDQFELVYVVSAYMQEDDVYSEKEKLNVIVKTRVSRKKPEYVSVIPVFENAEPYEREIHELFGIIFEGHPRLVPLFLEREYKIPPFRKDFDTRKYVEDVFDSIPVVEKKAENK